VRDNVKIEQGREGMICLNRKHTLLRRKDIRLQEQVNIFVPQAYTSHIMTKKSPKRKRKLRKTMLVSKQDAKRLRKLLPYK